MDDKNKKNDAERKKKTLHRTMRATQVLEILLILAAVAFIVVMSIQKLG